jgi:hypothetical protein
MYFQPKNIYSNLTCAYHPKFTLTNFCTHNDCMVPLCPECVNDHINEHA